MDDVFEEEEPSGFVKEFADAITRNIPTSREWAEAIALTVESTVLSKVKALTKIGPVSLNVWHLMIGPSGLAYKTTPMRYFVYPTLVSLTQKIEKPLIMPSRFSVEGMIEYLSMVHTKGVKSGQPKHNEGCIIRDEFSSMFKDYSSKSYLADVMEFLSELYDGTMQKRFTRKTKLEKTQKIYITMLAATTPYLFSIMERNFFVQGTGNRILYVLHEPKDLPVIDPEDFFIDGEKQRVKEGKIEYFANKLAELYKCSIRYIWPDEEAGKLWSDYKMRMDREAARRYKENPQDLEYTYMQRLPEMCLKLAGLYAISRSYEKIGKTKLDSMVIRSVDMKIALRKIESYHNHFLRMLEKWVITPRAKAVETEERNLVYVLNPIRENPDKLLTQREILNRTDFSYDKLVKLLGTLIQRGNIKKLRMEEVEALPDAVKRRHGISVGKKGRPQNVYKFVGVSK